MSYIADDLQPETVHEILSNTRRRLVLEALQEDETLTLGELADRIASRQADESPPPSDLRRNVYVSLQQTHFPKLDKAGIVDYDPVTKEVTPAERLDDITVFLEVVFRPEISWSEYYAGTSVLGLLVVVGAVVGVPLLADVGAAVLAVVVYLAILCSACYQWTRQRGIDVL